MTPGSLDEVVGGYVRIWEDEQGVSHFEDVRVRGERARSQVSTSESVYATLADVERLIWRRVLVEHPVDTPHPAPRRQFLVHLEGEAEVEVGDGEIRRFGPGDLVLLEDIHGSGHVTRNPTGTDRVTLFITLPEAQS